MPECITIHVDGRPVQVSADSSVAAAVMQTQGAMLRRSVTGMPRGPVCGMGVCFECRLTLDGTPHQRSCQTPCQAGMKIETGVWQAFLSADAPAAGSGRQECLPHKDFDVLVVGAGPAGIVAATRAAEGGQRVGIVDDNPHAGGQIWRHDPAKPMPMLPDAFLWNLRERAGEMIRQTQIIAVIAPMTLLADGPGGPCVLSCRRLILACGARERFLPFPGWTLPGVFGAGGLQALVKSGFEVAGKRIIVAGSGPLLLAVAAYLCKRGADIRLIAEQTPRRHLLHFASRLVWHHPYKLLEAIGLRWALRGIPYRAGTWPIRADGAERVQEVTLTDGAKTWTEPCDALACGFGLVPNLELPALLGCTIEDGFVRVDDHQQTSVPGVFAAGELTGIGGVDKALVDAHIAAWTITRDARAGQLHSRRAKTQRFVALLAEGFRLRDELRQLPERDTIVCRCEDVTFGQLQQCAGWRDAKLQTRCGMGPCQGRMCGPALEFFFGWPAESVRPPLFPTALANLAVGAAANRS